MLRAPISSLLRANPGPTVTQLRFRRKPRWIPTAPSKMFRIPQHPPQDPDERQMMMTLSNHYRTAMKSIYSYLKDEVEKQEAKTTVLHVSPEEEQAEFEQCMRLNDEWNAIRAKEREARLAKEAAEMRDIALKRMTEAEEAEEERRRRAQELIEAETGRSSTFITRENIDEAIEKALTEEKDYNFAINQQQDIFPGRRSGPNELPETDAVAKSG